MSDNINAEIIAIGTEILLGEITDTNSVFIAQQLKNMGINLYFMTSVGDNEQRIADSIRIALSRADVVITCGGLGPTIDDMTRQGVAIATNQELVYHQFLYDQITERFASFKMPMSENNRRQAYLPQNAEVIENPVGTAPSFITPHEHKIIISLPGVPREMKFLMNERVIPYLRQKYELGIIKARILKTAGIGESTLDEMLGTAILENANPSVGLAAHHGVIDIRITAKAADSSSADTMLAEMANHIREKAGKFIFGEDADELETVLLNLLQKHQCQLGICEAGLDGALYAKILDYQGTAFVHTHHQYAHPQDLIKVDEPLNLRELALQSAESVATNGAVPIGIAILSLPEINENADVDIATAVAVSFNGTSSVRTYGFGGQSELSREWVSRWALATIWRKLKEHFDVV